MPIYMDRHDVSNEVTAEIVAHLHQADLKIQDQFGCRGLTYWFDDKRKTAFCLIEAPDDHAIEAMHSHSHGQVPHRIIEVNTTIVESFLGRIEDPVKAQNSSLNMINDPAFRTIMKVGFKPYSIPPDDLSLYNSLLNHYSKSVTEIIVNFEGRIVHQTETDFLGSFSSVTNAVHCSLEIKTKIHETTSETGNNLFRLKIGLSAGVPVTENATFFEDTIKLAERMSYIDRAEIAVSSEVKDLYKSENLNQFIEGESICVLTPGDELFLKRLINFVEKEWKNNDLTVEDFNNYLGYSKSHLYRKMMALFGESPNNFLMSYRLDKAFVLLNKQSSNVSEVAFDSGFSDPSYFSKCFHRKFGLPPSAYLRLINSVKFNPKGKN